MKNFTGHEIGFSLDHWIDTKTGMFRATGPEHKYAVKELAKRLQDCVRHVFYLSDKSLWDEHCFDYELPPIDVSGVDIKFSDKVVIKEKKVRFGIGNTDLGINRCIDRYLDSGEPVGILSRDEPITIKQRILGEFRAASGNADKIGTINCTIRKSRNSVAKKASTIRLLSGKRLHMSHSMHSITICSETTGKLTDGTMDPSKSTAGSYKRVLQQPWSSFS